MKFHMEKAVDTVWKHDSSGDKTEELVEMSYELFEHLMDIRNNYLAGYDIGSLIKEFETGKQKGL